MRVGASGCRACESGLSLLRTAGSYAARAQQVPMRFFDLSVAVGGLSEDECGRPDHDAGAALALTGAPSARSILIGASLGGLVTAMPLWIPAGEGKRDNGDGEDSSDAGDDHQRPRGVA